MITLEQYFMGRDRTYKPELTDDILRNARGMVDATNRLLEAMAGSVPLVNNPATRSLVSSGWRPAAVNAATPGAALRSRHMSAQAVDLYDPEGVLDDWCTGNLQTLDRLALWMEHPAATKGWCHLQSVPPRSGSRVFYP